MNLRPYQSEAVAAVYEHLRTRDDNPCVVIPTGGGKTPVIATICRDAVGQWGGRVVLLAHVKELLEQAADKLRVIAPDVPMGIYSAGLKRKDLGYAVTVAGIQSIWKKACDLGPVDLIIVDEAHMVPAEDDGMYRQFIADAKVVNPNVRIIGLTATPYRMKSGSICAAENILNHVCYEVGVRELIVQGFLSPLKTKAGLQKISTDDLHVRAGEFVASEVEDLMDKEGLVEGACAEIAQHTKDRSATLIFSSGIRHGQHIVDVLKTKHGIECGFVTGDTPDGVRAAILGRFRSGELKYLCNVNVLTTGFDAPHIDCVALVRPTMSPGLYYQMVGRGFRLHPGKTDCLILDYTGCGHDIFSPEIADHKPAPKSVPVQVICPSCGHQNDFWGIKDADGELVEHFGRKCQGAVEDPHTFAITPCEFRFRFKRCDQCGAENDLAARQCARCSCLLIDTDQKLREAMALKDAHVMRPDSMIFDKTADKKGNSRLEVRYYDLDGEFLREYFYLNSPSDARAFYYNFMRMHLRIPELKLKISSADDVLKNQRLFRMPLFVIARKKPYYWQIREKIFE